MKQDILIFSLASIVSILNFKGIASYSYITQLVFMALKICENSYIAIAIVLVLHCLTIASQLAIQLYMARLTNEVTPHQNCIEFAKSNAFTQLQTLSQIQSHSYIIIFSYWENIIKYESSVLQPHSYDQLLGMKQYYNISICCNIYYCNTIATIWLKGNINILQCLLS